MECRQMFTMCRLCLCENECFFDIFQVTAWFGGIAAEVIRDLLQFQVSEMDGYPHVVCSVCLGKLTDFKQFKEKCQDSRDTYNNVFLFEESDAEHPIDIEEHRPVKLDPKDHLDTQEGQQETRKSGIACTSLEYLSCLRERTRGESDGSCDDRSQGINSGGKPLLEGREKVAVDGNPCENIRSSGSANVKVGKMDVKVRRGDCKSPGDVNRVESSVQELRKEVIEGREEVNRVDTSVDSILEDEETFTLKLEDDSDTGGESEREGGEEVPVGENEREGEKERIGSDSDTGGESEREGGEEVPVRENEREGEKGHFKCNDCGKDFLKKDVLIRHLGEHGYVVNEESSSEGRQFQANTNVNCGTKRSTNEACKKGLKNKRSVKRKGGKGAGKCVCPTCGKRYSTIESLKRHLIIHSGVKPFVCTVCDKRFSDRSNLKAHMLTHTGEKPFTCQICSKGFTRNVNLINHVRIHHRGENPYECQVCNKCFSSRSSLNVHLRMHSKEKAYACHVCSKCFSCRSHLKMHLRIHTKEKPYACTVCNKCFCSTSDLNVHLRIHTKEKPYECTVCNRCFSVSSTLKMHLRIHSK